MYGRVEKEFKEIQQVIRSVCIVLTAPSSLKTVELGDEPAQLRRLVDVIEVQLHRSQEEKDKSIESLNQEK